MFGEYSEAQHPHARSAPTTWICSIAISGSFRQNDIRDGCVMLSDFWGVLTVVDETLNSADTLPAASGPKDGVLVAGTMLGDYRIVELIGAGGMGAVYRAEHVMMANKEYAVKVVAERLAHDSGFLARFVDEGRAMADLRHPHIVSVHNVGRDKPSGRYFMAMDLVHGPNGAPRDLHAELESRPDNRLPESAAIKWLTQIADALACAHDQGIVHRDIKPSNILLDERGDVCLTDFGLAKAIGNEALVSQIHQTMEQTLNSADTLQPHEQATRGSNSSVLGTYDYMAPEQRACEQRACGKIDARTDIYAFGVLMYRVLTGKRPVGMAAPPSKAVPGISRKWDAVVARCLQDDPTARYASAAALLIDLKAIASRGSGGGLLRSSAALLLLAGAVAAVLWQVGVFDEQEARQPDPTVHYITNDPPTDTPVEPEPDPIPQPASVTRQEVVLLQTNADRLWELVKDVEPGQGLGDLLRAADTTRTNAEKFFKLPDWSNALENYAQLQTQCQTIAELDAARSVAGKQRTVAATARKAAQATLASDDAGKEWRLAEASMQLAAEQFGNGKFSDATDTWATACGQYKTAQTVAEAVQRAAEIMQAAQASQTQCNAVTEARNAARLRMVHTDAPVLWGEFEALRKEAQNQHNKGERARDAGEFREAEQKWDAAMTKLVEAGTEAKRVREGRAAAARAAVKLRGTVVKAAQDAHNSAVDRDAPALWKEFEALRRIAQTQHDRSETVKDEKEFRKAEASWKVAAAMLAEADRKATPIREARTAEVAAIKQRTTVLAAARAAQRAGVHRAAPKLWEEFEKLLNLARARYSEGVNTGDAEKFRQAEQTWKDAAAKLAQARARRQ